MPPIDDATRPRVAGSVELTAQLTGAVDDLAVAVRTDPSRVPELVTAVADLREDLESHFVYEETEMTEPLGLLGLGI